jgi:hypothetical protein
MADTARLIAALAERLRETLPPSEFGVEEDGQAVTVKALASRHAGSTLHLSGVIMFKLPLPASLRLQVFFENEADAVQEFVSKVQGKAWPVLGAEPHALVSEDQVHVWYGTGDEATAALRWRPFNRRELQL